MEKAIDLNYLEVDIRTNKNNIDKNINEIKTNKSSINTNLNSIKAVENLVKNWNDTTLKTLTQNTNWTNQSTFNTTFTTHILKDYVKVTFANGKIILGHILELNNNQATMEGILINASNIKSGIIVIKFDDVVSVKETISALEVNKLINDLSVKVQTNTTNLST